MTTTTEITSTPGTVQPQQATEVKENEGDQFTSVPLDEKEGYLSVNQAFFGSIINGNKFKKFAPMVATLVMDIALPVAIYFILKNYIDPVWALLAAGGPALIAVVLKGIIKRQLDIIGILVFCAFAISAVVAIVTGDPRILVFEKSIVTAVLGVVFLVSLIPFKIKSCRGGKPFVMKPFLYWVLQQVFPLGQIIDPAGTNEEENKYTWLWEQIVVFRKMLFAITAIWGIGFFVEFIGRLAMALSPMTLDQVVLWANVFFAIVIALLILGSVVYVILVKDKLRDNITNWLSEHKARLQRKEGDTVSIIRDLGKV